MEMQPIPGAPSETENANVGVGALKTVAACVAGALIPGLGHALLRKWDRAVVFCASIAIMVAIGIHLQGRLVGLELGDFFARLKFFAEAGSGLFYWLPLLRGAGIGDPTAYTYDYANVFLYVAGLLNMLVIIDAFDIAMGRKR